MHAGDWDARYASKDLVWSVGPNAFVEEYAASLPPGTALDVAGGEGRNALWLADRGWEATVADFSRVALDRAAHLWDQREGSHTAGGRVHVREVDVVNDDLGQQAYDLVIVCYLQLPADQRGPALRASAAAVAPGGHLFLIAHHSDNVTGGFGGPPDPAVNYTEADVIVDLGGSGLTIESAERVTRIVETPEGPREAFDARVVAARL